MKQWEGMKEVQMNKPPKGDVVVHIPKIYEKRTLVIDEPYRKRWEIEQSLEPFEGAIAIGSSSNCRGCLFVGAYKPGVENVKTKQ